MFEITYRPKNNRNNAITKTVNNSNEIYDIVLNCCTKNNKHKEAEQAKNWAESVSSGSKIVRYPDYKIEYIQEK